MITVDYCIDTLDDMSLALIWLNIWMSTCYFLFHVNILFGKLKFYFQLLGLRVFLLGSSNPISSEFKVGWGPSLGPFTNICIIIILIKLNTFLRYFILIKIYFFHWAQELGLFIHVNSCLCMFCSGQILINVLFGPKCKPLWRS